MHSTTRPSIQRFGKFRKARLFLSPFVLAFAICAALSLPAPGAAPPGSLLASDFGTVADGQADDTEAIQAAIDRAGEEGRPLLLPPGRYLISGDLNLNAPIQLFGSGHRESILTSAGQRARLHVRMSGTAIRDLGFEDMVEPVSLVSRSGYSLEDVRIERCRFENIEIQERNRGTIGLSSGRGSQRPHPIRYLLVRDCVFRNINARCIAIRANISEALILDNQFLNIVNPTQPGEAGPFGGGAIQLGESSDDAGMLEEFRMQGRHRIEGNVIRHMRKYTVGGNLIGALIYGNYNTIQGNIFEDIDGTAEGNDTNAMYIRGAYNRVLGNTIRNIHGRDDDGALCFKGGLDQGNQHSIIAHNTLQDIRGMSAMELSSSHLQVKHNIIEDAPVRGFYHRTGENLWLQDNTFVRADAVIRTARRQNRGEVFISGNRFINSAIVLSQFRRDLGNTRDAVYLHNNFFQNDRVGRGARVIRLANRVVEPFVSIRNNRFHMLGEDPEGAPAGRMVDLISSGNVQEAEIVGNHVVQRGPHEVLFRVGGAAGRGRFADNTFVIHDLRGPVMDGGFTSVENNTVRIAADANANASVPALFTFSGHRSEDQVAFRGNRIFNESERFQVQAVTRWRVEFVGPGRPVLADNVVEGQFGETAAFAGRVPDEIHAVGNRLPGMGEPSFVSLAAAPSRFSGQGSGTPENPYRVANAEQLQEMGLNLAAAYVLAGDIDASATREWDGGRGFRPVGSEEEPFNGTLDGRGHVIRNLHINRPDESCVGLFGRTGADAEITKAGVADARVEGYWAVGALVGLNGGGTVSQCFTTGSVAGWQDVGGLVGNNDKGLIADCYSLCDVQGHSYLSGLAGFSSGRITNTFAAGNVRGLSMVFGLVGYIGGWVEGFAIENSFWNAETSEQTLSWRFVPGKTAAEMRDIRTFVDAGWDIAPAARHGGETWVIEDGNSYPRLGWTAP